MEKLKKMDIALRIAGFKFKEKDLAIIAKMADMVDERTTIDQVLTAKNDIEAQYQKTDTQPSNPENNG